VQQIATTESGWPSALQLLVVIGIVLITVELPLLAYARRPEATTRAVRLTEAWTERHLQTTISAVLIVLGGYLIIDGIVSLA
jgi:hypothetical protein